jgi:hypothetical protein
MSTSGGWCSRAGFEDCFCGAVKPQYDGKDDTIREQAEIIEILEAALTRILGTANEPGQQGNREVQIANIATIAADALNPPLEYPRK